MLFGELKYSRCTRSISMICNYNLQYFLCDWKLRLYLVLHNVSYFPFISRESGIPFATASSLETKKFFPPFLPSCSGLRNIQSMLLKRIATHGSEPNPRANVLSSLICCSVIYLVVLPDLHSIASERPFFPASKSGQGNGIDPEPATRIHHHRLLQKRWRSSLSSLLPFSFDTQE